MSSDRVAQFRQQVFECEQRALSAKTEEMRRAWTIAAREWNKMVEREAAKPVTPEVASVD